MAKTESTAVNELINLVHTATPLKPDPSEDLMFRAPDKKTRMTSTVPAAEMPSLPRQRAPMGTQRGVPTVDGQPPIKPSVRMSTATVSRPMSIPTIPQWQAPEGTGEADAIGSDVITAVENVATRPTRPSLPLPARPSAPPPLPKKATSALLPAIPAMPLRTVAPPQTPVAAPFEARPEGSPIPASVVSANISTALPPLAAGYPSAEGLLPPSRAAHAPVAAPYLHAPTDMTSHQPWFDTQDPASSVSEIEVDLGTDRVRAKATDWKLLLPKLIVPTLGLIILGMFVGGYLAFDGQGGKQPAPIETTAPATAASEAPTKAVKADEPAKVDEPVQPAKVDQPVATPEPAPITPPNIAPHADSKIAPAEPGLPTFVDVRIDSKPSGATVTLVDRGKTMFLGTTPISTALDPSRQYDIVFTYQDKPTQIERLDPATTKRLAVVLGKAAKQAAPKAEAPKRVEAPKQAKVVEPAKTEPAKTEPAKTDAKKAVVDPFDAAPVGEGTLMISSKPPCEILIDGVATGLTTPQRAIKLPTGKHKITLVNTAEKIKKTLPVTITADQPTKVIENFMK